MESFITLFRTEKKYLETLEKDINKTLKHSPEGSLRFHRRKHGLYYEKELTNKKTGKKEIIYLSKKNTKELSGYIGKYCAMHVMPELIRQKKLLCRNPALYDRAKLQHKLEELETIFGELTPEAFYSGKTILRKWEEEPYTRNPRPIDPEKRAVSDRGEVFRSKNELIIAQLLRKLGIPYHYEETLITQSGWLLSPDFVIKSPADGEIYFLEVFGMMSDPAYAARTAEKLREYEKDGIIPGEKLIMIFLYGSQTIDMEALERLLKKKFIEGE